MSAPIRSYPATLWSAHCQQCGAELCDGFSSATAAREWWENLHALEGAALCDDCWPDPSEATA